MDNIDLEISFSRRDSNHYNVDMRYNNPGDQVDRWEQAVVSLGCFDINSSAILDPLVYGQHLSDGLFSDRKALDFFQQARSAAETLGTPLRLRLLIGPSAPELHNLHWETLCDPVSVAQPLLTGERIWFSRYLTSFDWRPVRLRPQGELRALVAIANPRDLPTYQPGGRPLASVDVAGELGRARVGLSGITIEPLTSPGDATLGNLLDGLRRGCDILYLVCHGAFKEGESYLWLEDKAGNSNTVAGREVATRLSELLQLPRLVILVSCQSAGGGPSADALAALGPLLAEIGIPAVLAMQGKVSMKTAATFLPVFFRELQGDGHVDRAMAVARSTVLMERDWWMPVLFTRLRQGRIWYAVGFTEARHDGWQGLIEKIKDGKCTPILGPDLYDALLGSRREIAQRWANSHGFPMAPYHREDLPQVAQYLDIKEGARFPRDQLMKYLKEDMWRRYRGDLLPDVNHASSPPARLTLTAMIQMMGVKLRERDPDDPFVKLAALPIPIYVATSPVSLLEEALRAAGKAPQTELCRWNNEIKEPSHRRDPGHRPSPDEPLIYRPFGNLDVPNSWVLTEDDYFNCLIGVTKGKNLIPHEVRHALCDSSLLFLGFQMEDWSFRVLLRFILSLEGHAASHDYIHVAAQIAPEEGRILDPEGARRYLERYFTRADIRVFWGGARDFLKELSTKYYNEVSS